LREGQPRRGRSEGWCGEGLLFRKKSTGVIQGKGEKAGKVLVCQRGEKKPQRFRRGVILQKGGNGPFSSARSERVGGKWVGR